MKRTFLDEDCISKRLSQKLRTSSESGCSVYNDSAHDCSTKPNSTHTKLTPFQQQVITLREANAGAILFIECGYKYRLFGNDASIGKKELNIGTNIYKNWLSSSIPNHRLHVHIKRLLVKGYKVGVVNQSETAGLKSISNDKSEPFQRKLTHLYSRGIYIDPTGYKDNYEDVMEGPVLIVKESDSTIKNHKLITILSVDVKKVSIIYDEFDDSLTRINLWTYLLRVKPVEFVIVGDISSSTLSTMKSYESRDDFVIRTENIGCIEFSLAFYELTKYFHGQQLEEISQMSHGVVQCLATAFNYLNEFNMGKTFKGCVLCQYNSKESYMALPATTLSSLHIIDSKSSQKFTLFSLLNKTCTKFGSRTLREWILHPLLKKTEIERRQNIVNQLMVSDSWVTLLLNDTLKKLPDFTTLLTTILYQKCTPSQFFVTVNGLHDICKKILPFSGTNSNDEDELRFLLSKVTTNLKTISQFSAILSEEGCRKNLKSKFLLDWSPYSDVSEKSISIGSIEKKLSELKTEYIQVHEFNELRFAKVCSEEYLIEVNNTELLKVPNNWILHSTTKSFTRYRPPDVIQLFRQLTISREELDSLCHRVWIQILDEFSQYFHHFQSAVNALGELDALFSLSKVARLYGYTKPNIVLTRKIEIVNGKHPLFSINNHQYITNNTCLQEDGTRVMIISGANMGGKSCYLNQVALICIMAQIGSFVPADYAQISPLDAIYVRTGAYDDILGGRSSFMVEANQASHIMANISPQTLVIMDEFGRSTSTTEGKYIGRSCSSISYRYKDCEKEIVFVYDLVKGKCLESYGLNVARLAGLPKPVLNRALLMSNTLKEQIEWKRQLLIQFRSVFRSSV